MSSDMLPNIMRRNDATAVNGNYFNGVHVQETITVRGSDVYYAICTIMGLTSLTVLGLSYLKPRRDRIFFYITAALNFTAFIAYFTMGSNLGWVPINVEFLRSDPIVDGTNRSIFYARYIDWVITTPLLLMDLLLTAGLPWPTIIWVIFWDEVMIVTGLVGALVSTRYKFGFFAIGTAAMFYVFYELIFVGRPHANALGKDIGRAFTICGCITLVVWLGYPIAWGCSEGGNVIASDSEAVFYGVLDFLAKPIFSAALIYSHWGIDPARTGAQIKDYNINGMDVRSEKDRDDHPYEQSNARDQGYNPSNTHTIANTTSDTNAEHRSGFTPAHGASDSHAAHRSGFAPAHERTTVEGAPHTSTV